MFKNKKIVLSRTATIEIVNKINTVLFFCQIIWWYDANLIYYQVRSLLKLNYYLLISSILNRCQCIIYILYLCILYITCLGISLTNSNSGAIFIILKNSLYETIDEV